MLAVIAIIGLLASIALVLLDSSRKKARDAKRVAELRAVTTAIVLYSDSNNNTYPFANSHQILSTRPEDNNSWKSILGNFLKEYISAMPSPPSTPTSAYNYYYAANNDPDNPFYLVYGNSYVAINKGAYIWTQLEATNDLSQRDGGINPNYYEIFIGDYLISL